MKIEITKINRDFSKVRFVLAAKAKESSRYAIESVWVDEKVIVATDGRRLHRLQTEIFSSYAAGLYDVVKCTKSVIVLLLADDQDAHFPKYQDIFPDHEDYFEISSSISMGGNFINTVLGILGKKDITLNYRFLLPLEDYEGSWSVYFGKPERVIHFVDDKLDAVIMPVNSTIKDVKFKKKVKNGKANGV